METFFEITHFYADAARIIIPAIRLVVDEKFATFGLNAGYRIELQ